MYVAMSQLHLLARVYHGSLKLARTVADLVRSEEIQPVHLAEALHASQQAEVDVELTVNLCSRGAILRRSTSYRVKHRFEQYLLQLRSEVQMGFKPAICK